MTDVLPRPIRSVPNGLSVVHHFRSGLFVEVGGGIASIALANSQHYPEGIDEARQLIAELQAAVQLLERQKAIHDRVHGAVEPEMDEDEEDPTSADGRNYRATRVR